MPARIYIVRDGRSAITSFRDFERQHSPAPGPNSLLQIAIGDRYFGTWSDHYPDWHGTAAGVVLTVRYDEIFHAGPCVLARIADFARFTSAIRRWANPLQMA